MRLPTMSDIPPVPFIANDDPKAVEGILYYLQSVRNAINQVAGKAQEFVDLDPQTVPGSTETVIATLDVFPEGGFVMLLGSCTITLNDGETAEVRIRATDVTGTILGGPTVVQGSAATTSVGGTVVGAHLEPPKEQTYVLTIEHTGVGDRDVGNRRLIAANLNMSKGVV